MCTRLLMIDDMCRNQKRFWEKIRFDETAAAFEIQKEKKMILFHAYIQSGFLCQSYECLHIYSIYRKRGFS